jgi:predicted ATPase
MGRPHDPSGAASPESPGIKTPDQRLRVFVSSTLGELADERVAVSRAITALRLTPVLFELGARPYPPQAVYRAYLEQSDIFIGLYWQRYGWIGPDMEISGLEDEFEQSRSLPRLLYVKAPAPDREPRLSELLNRVKTQAADSYRSFGTARELGRLVRDDLAVLLSERFAAARATGPETSPQRGSPHRPLPGSTTSLIGRERDIDEICRLVALPEVRLVTLTGPGGIGKSRLAVGVGERLGSGFSSGTVFVPLESVTQPELVLPAVARAAGANLAGVQSPVDALVEYFGDAPFLLVLDNVEQVVGAAPELADLLARCPGVTMLATSRIALGLRAEHEYPVPPLALPAESAELAVEDLDSLPAVELFVDRARAVHPDFALTDANIRAVVEICRRLEGLPLAIELAAARTRLLDPHALLARLTKSLDALGSGSVDLPERQRTLRATVDWSIGLLDEEERSMLDALAVFVDGWTSGAASHVAGTDEDRALDLIEALARHSLVQVDTGYGEPRFRMLGIVRDFVVEDSAQDAERPEMERRHAGYFRALAERADRPLRGDGQAEWVERLRPDAGNLAAAVRWFLTNDVAPLPHLFRVLWLFWWLEEHLGEARSWMRDAIPAAASLDVTAQSELAWSVVVTSVEVGDDTSALEAREQLESLIEAVDDRFLVAISELALAWVAPIVDDFDGAFRRASRAVEMLDDGEPFWTALAVGTLGLTEATLGRQDAARQHLTQAFALGERFDNDWITAASRVQLGTLAVMQGRLDDARSLLEEGLSLSLDARSTQNVTMSLTALARLAFAAGDPERAAAMLGAADGLRRRASLAVWPSQRGREADLTVQVEEAIGEQRFREEFTAGSRLSRSEAVVLVRSE